MGPGGLGHVGVDAGAQPGARRRGEVYHDRVESNGSRVVAGRVARGDHGAGVLGGDRGVADGVRRDGHHPRRAPPRSVGPRNRAVHVQRLARRVLLAADLHSAQC